MAESRRSRTSRPVALVTGASGGLGTATCEALVSMGFDTIGWGRNAFALNALDVALAGQPGSFSSRVVDLREPGAVADGLAALEHHAGPVAVFVAITGGPRPGSAATYDRAAWEEGFASMVLPVLQVASAVLPGMRDRGWGRIITCVSSGVVSPIDGLGLSNALRSCLVGWSKTLANEVASAGVTCNVVVPGRFATRRVAELDESRARARGLSVDNVRAASVRSIPTGRYGDPSEFANVVAFLAGESSSYVNGSMVRVDGGMIPGI